MENNISIFIQNRCSDKININNNLLQSSFIINADEVMYVWK